MRRIRCREYLRTEVSRDALPSELALELHRRFGRYVSVEPPSIFSDCWTLTPKSYVGFIPLAQGFMLQLEPKVPVGNLFRMLEYAWRLDLNIPPGDTSLSSMQEFIERLAVMLARKVLQRARRGFYRTYVPHQDQLPYLRGRMDLAAHSRAPWSVRMECLFEEHTGDIPDNQILAWTLHQIGRTGLCRSEATTQVRAAYLALQNCASVIDTPASACVGRTYHRLNEDYELLHGLCRFFLEHAGPSHLQGGRHMLPFVVNMAHLFESFVAEWLRLHLPPTYTIRAQQGVNAGPLRYAIDLVISDHTTGAPFCVLDTKYKRINTPAHADVNQMLAYAKLAGCREAWLVYPAELPEPFAVKIENVLIRAISFNLEGQLEESGRQFVERLLLPRGELRVS